MALLAILGMRTVFMAAPRLYQMLQICGGIYLSYIGLRIWRKAEMPVSAEGMKLDAHAEGGNTFRSAFLIQISNPKTIVFFSSVFASILPDKTPAGIAAILLILVFIVQSAWYSLVAVLLSASKSRAAYMRARIWIDRAAGSLILILGFRVLTAVFWEK